VEEQVLPVASHLPYGYLSVQPLGLGKGVMVINFYEKTDSSWVSEYSCTLQMSKISKWEPG
jgi:hypothetical protein